MSPRIIFAGTPEFAATSLQALLDQSYEVVAVYTQPDRPSGRGRKLTPSPVKQIALDANIPVYQPLNFRQQEDVEQLKSLNADLMIVVAYGLLLPLPVLEAPSMGCINVHGSLLPRWRGAAPIHRALMAGDQETGITIMKMDVGLDTGDMLLKSSFPITSEDTSGSLHDQLAELGANTLLAALQDINSLLANAQRQDEKYACYAHKLTKQEGEIDWQQPAQQISLQIRGLSPWPVAFTSLEGQTLRIWDAQVTESTDNQAAAGTIIGHHKQGIEVACGEGSVYLTRLQMSGGKPLAAKDLLNSKQALFAVGVQLGAHHE